jgi:hypothetical protein
MRWCRWCRSYPVGMEHSCKGLVEAQRNDQRISDEAERRADIRGLGLWALGQAVADAARRDDALRRLEAALRGQQLADR